MWTFREMQAFSRRANEGFPFRFRVKLTVLLMLIVIAVTMVALYVVQRAEQTSSQQNLQQQFRSRLASLLAAQDVRQAEVSEQCRALAQVVRIQAALEEGDVEDLYVNAKIELRNVLVEGNPSSTRSDVPPRATFFRFLSADGKLLKPPGLPPILEAWEEQLVNAGQGTANQQFGYVPIKNTRGEIEINQVVCTPILGSDGLPMASLVLGFPSIDTAVKPDSEIKTGIWLDGELYMSSLTRAESHAMSGAMSKAFQISSGQGDNFTVNMDGEPYLLFYKVLNPGSRFAPAYEVCLYSLKASLAEQQRVRWKILAVAALILVVGLVASHSFSARMALPVEQLEEVSAQNVARREEAEAARAMTEQKYRSIFENAVEGIFLMGPDGRYLSANPAMSRIFGCDSNEQLIRMLFDPMEKIYVNPERGGEFLHRVQAEGTVLNFESQVQRRDGTVLWISQNGRAIRDAAGQLLHIEGTMEDITDRKKAADSMRELNSELEKALADLKATQNQVIQQERLRALGQMASGIAHDFNNSLMPVMGFAELLLARPDILNDKKKSAEYLGMIRTAAKDAASIVARLREFYRSQEQTDIFAPLDIVHLAREAISLSQPKWKDQARASGIEIQVIDKLSSDINVMGDESALREVFINLIFNAVDAMPKGGSITLDSRVEGKQVFVEVSDTGTGMTEEVRQRCLEPFFTTKGDRGTGLGLAMVFGIVQRHGGTIDIRSEIGRGTTISAGFPVAAPASAKTASQTVAPTILKALKILLVEDEPQVCQVLMAFLESDGHDVKSADHGADGLALFREGQFDLVITDKAMPGMSGDQMAMEINRLSPRTPIILLSGFNAAGETEKIPGISVIACKPITIPALREAIRKALQSA